MPATTVLPRPTGGPLPLFVGLLRSESRKLAYGPLHLLGAARRRGVQRADRGTAGRPPARPPQRSPEGHHRLASGSASAACTCPRSRSACCGVLAVTGEYSSGMIRATLAAVPQRRLLLTAKALVFTAAAAATGIAACLAAYLVFQAFLPAGDAMRTTLADPGVLRGHRGRPVPHGPGPARLRARHRPALQRRRGRGLVRRAVRAHPPSRAAAVIVAGHHRPLTCR